MSKQEKPRQYFLTIMDHGPTHICLFKKYDDINQMELVEKSAFDKAVKALQDARKRLSHIENWHRDYVTPDNFKDCQDVGMTPEAYLRDGKNEVDKALRELGVEI